MKVSAGTKTTHSNTFDEANITIRIVIEGQYLFVVLISITPITKNTNDFTNTIARKRESNPRTSFFLPAVKRIITNMKVPISIPYTIEIV